MSCISSQVEQDSVCRVSKTLILSLVFQHNLLWIPYKDLARDTSKIQKQRKSVAKKPWRLQLLQLHTDLDNETNLLLEVCLLTSILQEILKY